MYGHVCFRVVVADSATRVVVAMAGFAEGRNANAGHGLIIQERDEWRESFVDRRHRCFRYV